MEKKKVRGRIKRDGAKKGGVYIIDRDEKKESVKEGKKNVAKKRTTSG